MAGRCIEAARFIGNTPFIRTGAQKTSETFKIGALLVVDANGELAECAADPTLVSGVALQGADSNPGFAAANSPTVFTGRQQTVSYVVADKSTTFSMRGVNGATDPVTPTQTMVGESYGAARDADGVWYLDIAETTVKVWDIVAVDITNKIFFCVFNDTALS